MPTKNHKLETNNLLLKPVSLTDLNQLIKIYANPNNMQYIGDGYTLSKNKAYQKVCNLSNHWHEHNFGMWALQKKINGKVIGYAGFRYFEDHRPKFHKQIELGYIIDEPYWKKGYATEAVSACVRTGLKKYQMQRLLATINPLNIASQKIVMSLGFQHTFNAKFCGRECYIYELNNTQYSLS